MSAPTTAIDFSRLMKLRLVVARFGEMDLAQWWNTTGMLGRLGRIAVSRGFPKTFHFAQARAVFAVARHRCREVFHPPRCITLWELPAEIEDQFETHWQSWLDRCEEWESFFASIEQIRDANLLSILQEFHLFGPEASELIKGFRRSPEGKSIPIPGVWDPGDEIIRLLVLGFARNEKAELLVPYARMRN